MRQYRGSISIYFVFAIVLIISVILSVTEIARINCQKLYLQIATDSALDSMASLYHRKLYKYYSLYGVEYRTLDMLETEYLEYMYPYFVDEERPINNWYIANIDNENINMAIKTLTDNVNLEKEIINYEKYNLVGKTIKFLGKEIFVNEVNDNKLYDEAKEIFKEVEKNNIYGEIHEVYFNFADDIKLLESYAKKISDYVDRVNLSLNNIKSCGTSGSKSNAETVLKKFDELSNRISNLYNNLLSFKNKMADFRRTVDNSYFRYIDDKASGRYDFNDEIVEFIESEFEHFKSFTDENSDMNKAVEEGFNNCRELNEIISDDYEEILNYVAEHESLEWQLKEARRQRGEDYDSEEVASLKEDIKDLTSEVSDFLKGIKESYRDVKMERIQIIVSTSDNSENDSLIKKLIGFKNGILINLILDSETISNISSETVNYRSFNMLSNNNSLTFEKILFGEYELDKFNYFNKELNDEFTPSGSKRYEIERLITGRTDDMSSIKAVINQILLIRIAMNVLHIYKSSEKRQAARRFTAIAFGGFSPLMVEAMFLVMISAWGVAQSIVDMKRIMNNKRVKFMHDNESWTVSVDSILNIAKTQMVNAEDNDDTGLALNYKDYLRLLLLKTNQSDINARMASIIDKNIKDEQASFDFEKMVYSFLVNNNFHCVHMFTNLVFVPAKDITLYDRYSIKTNGYRCFYENKE